jgi:hypothetical protein
MNWDFQQVTFPFWNLKEQGTIPAAAFIKQICLIVLIAK